MTMLPLIAAGYHPTVPTVFVLWTVAGLGAGAINLVMPIYTAQIPNEYRSLGYGIGSTGLMVGQGLASLGGGLIATAVGASLTITLLGELGLLAVAVLAVRWPTMPALHGETPALGPAVPADA
jgi:MFS family permease